jgi:hypothetical protein
MSLNIFKAAVRTLSNNQPDFELIAKGVRHMQKCGFSEREIFRAALGTDDQLEDGVWSDAVKTAFERHPA